MMTVVGHCPHCGAPIYAPTAFWGVGAPPSTRTCTCVPQPVYIATSTTNAQWWPNTTGAAPQPDTRPQTAVTAGWQLQPVVVRW